MAEFFLVAPRQGHYCAPIRTRWPWPGTAALAASIILPNRGQRVTHPRCDVTGLHNETDDDSLTRSIRVYASAKLANHSAELLNGIIAV